MVCAGASLRAGVVVRAAPLPGGLPRPDLVGVGHPRAHRGRRPRQGRARRRGAAREAPGAQGLSHT